MQGTEEFQGEGRKGRRDFRGKMGGREGFSQEGMLGREGFSGGWAGGREEWYKRQAEVFVLNFLSLG